uniref:RNA helicase n=1 Tax=Electrophorus electricus TaxID=8005 RepID=A0A4W4GT21_ELEEL
MLIFCICKVEDPGCLWGRVLKGPGLQGENEYNDLQVKMNLFYHEVDLDVQKVKPTTLEEGQLCVVFCPAMRSWCRATVESLFLGSVRSQAMCFLVDHGERVIVSTEDVRAPLDKFLQLPFRMQRFQLARIHPMRLKVSICHETAHLVPSPQWDRSATKYLHDLLQASTLVEAFLCETHANCTAVELYLTIRNVKICVNDDLVVKKFACFSSGKAMARGEQSGSGDHSPTSLAWDDIASPHKILEMNGCCTVRPPHSRFLTRRGMNDKYLSRKYCFTWSDTNESWCVVYIFTDLFVCVKHSGTRDTHDNNTELQEPAFCQGPNTTDQLVCARLLQLLNPDPLNLCLECLDDNCSSSGVLVHSVVPISPCSSLSRAAITPQFRKFLLRRKYSGPNLAESYFWPAVARGCDTLLVSSGGGDPLSYLPPLLAQLQLASVYSTFTAHTGPIAVILCPSWEKVQSVLELLEHSQATGNLRPAAVLLGLGKGEAKRSKIHTNCQLLVTTPFSLSRLLEEQCFQFLRLCHLVLDEAHELFSRAPDQMAAILEYFKKVVSREETGTCPRQMVAVSRHWSQELEGVVQEHMLNPCIIVTVTEEAALYGGVHQMVLLCLECNKTSVLLSSLDFNPSIPQKTLIITNSAKEVEHVYKAVSSAAVFSLKVHEGLAYQFDFVVEQWKKDIDPGTQVILVTTNDCMKALGIRDATCVVHYGFPSSPKLFGNRLFCMSDNFRNLSEKVGSSKGLAPTVRSVLILSERNARHVSGVLRYLRRAGAALPSELLQFAQGVQQAREEQKTDRVLCSHLKSLGFCRDSTLCPDRHIINKTLDRPLHPENGTILVLPLYIKSANVYYGRIVKQKDDPYEILAAEMCSHYAKERLFAKEVVEGGLYAVQEEDIYSRVHVTKVPDRRDQLFSSVTAHFLDEGRTQEVKSHQLLQLPPEFQSLPSQAVEIILCRAQPIDGEMDWDPKVTRVISLKIKGKLHQAKVVMCLGNTVWVDPMIRMTRLPGLKTVINEYNVHAEVLATGMGTTNPGHLELLRALCLGEFEAEAPSLEQRVQAAEDVLANRMKAALVSVLNWAQKNWYCAVCGLAVGGCHIAKILLARVRKYRPHRDDTVGIIKSNLKFFLSFFFFCSPPPPPPPPPIFSFHPQIKWFQAKETVTLRVKLLNPINQNCEFFTNRVLYSAYVNNRRYCANLDLHSDISMDQCSWEMNCNEPVIKLVKKKKGEWKSLLKYKSYFVSYDFDHFEDEEAPLSKPVSNGMHGIFVKLNTN